MDKELQALERQLRADPSENLLQRLSCLYGRSGRKNDALKTRIKLRLQRGEISQKRVEMARALGYDVVKDILPSTKIKKLTLSSYSGLYLALSILGTNDKLQCLCDYLDKVAPIYESCYPETALKKLISTFRLSDTSGPIPKLIDENLAINANLVAESLWASVVQSRPNDAPFYIAGAVVLMKDLLLNVHTPGDAMVRVYLNIFWAVDQYHDLIAWLKNRLFEYLVGEAQEPKTSEIGL